MSRLTHLALACSLHVLGCGRPLERNECDVLLDHYTERLLVQERPKISKVEIKKKQEQAKELAKLTPRFEYERCSELVTRNQFECAMNAKNVDGIERCLL